MPNVIGMTYLDASHAINAALDGLADVVVTGADVDGFVIASDPAAGYCLDAVLPVAEGDDLDMTITLTID